MLGQKYLKQVHGISNYFIRSFCCANEYIVILTQTGELIYVDERLRATKLHIDRCKHSKRNKEDRLESITITKNNIIGMSRNEIYIWTPEKTRPPVHPILSSNENSSRYQTTSRATLSSERSK